MSIKNSLNKSINCIHYNFIGYPDLAMAAAEEESRFPSEPTGVKGVTRRGVVAKLNVHNGNLNPWDILTDLVIAYNLDLNFVLALIAKESGHMWQGHPDLVAAESRGATGVMQLRHWPVKEYVQGAQDSDSTYFPAKIAGLEMPDKYDVIQNIQCGLWYLRRVEKWLIEPIINHRAESLVDLAVLAVGYYNPESAQQSQRSLKRQTLTGIRVEDYWKPVLYNYQAFSRAEDNIIEFGDPNSPDLERILQEASNKVYNPSAIKNTSVQLQSDGLPKFTASRRPKQKPVKRAYFVDNKYIRF